jgi:hypothetical protein
MDERYRSIYADIYTGRTAGLRDNATLVDPAFQWTRYARAALDPVAARTVRAGIEGAESTRRRLREDAKALLAVNFEDLILVPLRLGGQLPEGELADPSAGLADDIKSDIAMLTSSARADVSPAGVGEISGHAIIDSLSDNWSQLRVSRFNLWENSANE